MVSRNMLKWWTELWKQTRDQEILHQLCSLHFKYLDLHYFANPVTDVYILFIIDHDKYSGTNHITSSNFSLILVLCHTTDKVISLVNN